jgi:hypothetical protein
MLNSELTQFPETFPKKLKKADANVLMPKKYKNVKGESASIKYIPIKHKQYVIPNGDLDEDISGAGFSSENEEEDEMYGCGRSGGGFFDKLKSGVSRLANSDAAKKLLEKVTDKAVDMATQYIEGQTGSAMHPVHKKHMKKHIKAHLHGSGFFDKIKQGFQKVAPVLKAVSPLLRKVATPLIASTLGPASYPVLAGLNQFAASKGYGLKKLPKSTHKRYTARGAIVAEVMKKHGLSLPQASRYVKEHSLY